MEMSRIVYEAKVGVLNRAQNKYNSPLLVNSFFSSLMGKVYQYSEAHRSAESWTKGDLH